MVSGCRFRVCGRRSAHRVVFVNRGAHVVALGIWTLTETIWSTVSGFKGLENHVVVLFGAKDIDDDWRPGVAYVGMSRARPRLDVFIRQDCDENRREREMSLAERQNSAVEMAF